MRTACSALAVVMSAFALGACSDSSSGDGESTPAKTQSAADAAQSTVCAARDDIGKQVETLKGLTAATVTKDGVTQSVAAIKKDLQEISGAQSTLSSDRRSEVEAANTAFTASIEQIAGEVRSSLSTSGAKAAVVTALEQLGASYEKTFAPLNCD